MVPADDQAMVLPWASVMVIIVLLNVAFTCATRDAMFLRSRRRTRVASLPMLNPFAARLRCAEAVVAVRVLREFQLTASSRRSVLPVPCGCARWCECVAHAPAAPAGDATRGSSRGPSAA